MYLDYVGDPPPDPVRPRVKAGAPIAPAAFGVLGFAQAMRNAPELATRNPRLTSFMRYRAAHAEPPRELPTMAWTVLGEISPYLVCAVIRAEDPAFFLHHGIGWRRLREAIAEAWRQRKPVRGVSTITQQLARNLYLHPERSIRRKVAETLLARRLEHVLTKPRILELYLNVIEWGDGIWGVGCAASAYFSRRPAELDAFQAVVLASLLPAPRLPLSGWNAARAVRSQKSLAVDLYGCGLLSRTEEYAVRKRIAYFERAIGAGMAAQYLYQQIAQQPYELTVVDRPLITTQKVIDDGGGLERWRGFVNYVRESTSQTRSVAKLPLWWTDRGIQDAVQSSRE